MGQTFFASDNEETRRVYINIARLAEYGISYWEYMNMIVSDIYKIINVIIQLKKEEKDEIELNRSNNTSTTSKVPHQPPKVNTSVNI